MKRLGATVAIVALVLGLSAVAVGAASAQQETTMTVSVTDQSGNPIQNAEVTAAWSGGEGTATTVANGNALIDVPDDADVEVSVTHPDFVQNIPKEVDDPAAGVSIEMAPPGTAEMTVVDTESGDPVEGVELVVTHTDIGRHDDGAEVATVETDANGVAEITDVEQRAYAIETHRPGYLVNETTFDLDDETVSEQIEIESRNVEIEFTVTDSYLDSPLQGATIQVDSSSAGTTTSDGTQVTRLAVNDDYEISVGKQGYNTQTRQLRVDEEATGIEIPIRRTPAISIEPLQTAVVTGQRTQVTIRNAYGDPVSGATVSLNDETVGQTNAQGVATFNVTEAGENTVSAATRGLEASVTIEGIDPDQSSDDSADNESDDGGDDSVGPGFGAIVALVAVVALGVARSRRDP